MPSEARDVRLQDEQQGNQSDRLLKFRWMYEQLLYLVQLAWHPEQLFAFDESMIACFSKFCGYIQRMERKPIKCGIKVYCLNFANSGYLYNWEIYLGKGGLEDGNSIFSLIYEMIV